MKLNIAMLLINGGIALWFIAGIGLLALPSQPGDEALGLYLLILQIAALYGARRLRESGVEGGVSVRESLHLLVPALLSFNIVALTGLGLLYARRLTAAQETLDKLGERQPKRVAAPSMPKARPVEPESRGVYKAPRPAGQRPALIQPPHPIGIPRDYSRLLGVKLRGVFTGLGCRGRFKACIGESLLPGYGGCWDACLLGCGGWGCAFKASRNGEVVVFKVPRGLEALIMGQEMPTVSEDMVKRVADEARAIKALKHPHLLNLLGYGRGIPLLVYEYADGGNIPWQLKRGWRPNPDTVTLMGVQLGDALRYIHTRGLIHGDVKPANIFIVNGVAKLGDFSGLTRLLGQVSIHAWSYTPGWRAPEQVYSDLRAKAAERGLENRVDVYQLGNLLLYTLTLQNIDGEEAIKPTTLKTALAKIPNKPLAQILSLMMRPAPWERPSMDEAVAKLASII